MDEFDRYRTEMNEKLLRSNHLGIKRFFALDTQAYEDGALDKRTKELFGLWALDFGLWSSTSKAKNPKVKDQRPKAKGPRP